LNGFDASATSEFETGGNMINTLLPECKLNMLEETTQMSFASNSVILLASDLMLSSTVSGCAAQAGRSFCNAGSVADVVAAISEDPAALLLVDLGTPGLNVASLADSIPGDVLQRAVAYGPHVHTEKLDAAEKAGFGKVMSRGQFSAQVSTLIADS
jgi:hypothetical protein